MGYVLEVMSEKKSPEIMYAGTTLADSRASGTKRFIFNENMLTPVESRRTFRSLLTPGQSLSRQSLARALNEAGRAGKARQTTTTTRSREAIGRPTGSAGVAESWATVMTQSGLKRQESGVTPA